MSRAYLVWEHQKKRKKNICAYYFDQMTFKRYNKSHHFNKTMVILALIQCLTPGQ